MIWFTQETVRHRGRAPIDSPSAHVSVPRAIRTQFVAPAITGFGAMALVGFFAALMPAILSHDLHIESHAAAGALFFELAVDVRGGDRGDAPLDSRTAMRASLALMIPAAAMLVAAQFLASLRMMLAATRLRRLSAGLGYRGSLQMVNQIAPEDTPRRSGVELIYLLFRRQRAAGDRRRRHLPPIQT